MKLLQSRLGIFSLVILAEIAAIAVTYQLFLSFECSATHVETGCRALRSMFLRGFSVVTLLSLFFWLRPAALRSLSVMIKGVSATPSRLAAHFLGVTLIFLPVIIFPGHSLAGNFATALIMMALGAFLAGIGALLWLAPLGKWRVWVQSQGWLLALIVAIGAFTPDFANFFLSLWNVEAISRLTFSSVQYVLHFAHPDAVFDSEHYVIGANDFFVQVAAQCSGVEGFALISVFSAIYAAMMGRDLYQKKFWLVLFPLALLASWALNVVRIAVLILIGINGAAEHAQNGFHSYAGWLLFTLLSLLILVIAQNWRWLHPQSVQQTNTPRLAEDWPAARLLPFMVFLVSGILATTFWQQPELAYPYRLLAMGCVLWYFRAPILSLQWRPDLPVVLAGLIVGGFWAMIGLQTTTEGGFDPDVLVGVWVAIWVMARLIGTIAFVPIIEELVFRGYILHRLGSNGKYGRFFALVVSSGLFGLMHGRWIEGFTAGLVFGLLYIRRDKLADAIIAHAIANAIVGFAALAAGNWSII